MRRGQRGLQRDRYFESTARPFQVAALQLDAAQGVVGFSRAGIGIQCGKHVLLRPAPVLPVRRQDAQAKELRVASWIDGREDDPSGGGLGRTPSAE
jgi:hypothetical protein